MEQRTLGSTGQAVSVVGLGTWQLGTDWGDVSESQGLDLLSASVEEGVTFFDTADVYGDGRSEALVGRFLAEHPSAGVYVATKMGRRAEQVPQSYTLRAFREWTDRSRKNLGVDRLDLVQLHCPPTEVLTSAQTRDALETLVAEERIAAYAVSVETCDQALASIDALAPASIQIILNAFRRKPLEQVLPRAAEAGVGVIARVPLASGLLSGRYTKETTFAETDHRTFNRHGAAFDVGETFAGVDFETGVDAAQEFSRLVDELGPDGATPVQVALRWVVQQGATSVIPGARNVEQARANAAAAAIEPLSQELLSALENLYDERIRAQVHHRW
ncbi:aldo/keto reductase [Georgenia halophila]|uniref:Aldo/keto reductase n=1 Tax=Georgenia halophila TaxID=620889 RepID=A0ABP8LSG7_9MICO